MPVATQRGGAEATLLDLIRHGRQDAEWVVVFLEDGPMVERVQSLEAESLVIPAGRVRDLARATRVSRRLGTVFRASRSQAIVSWMSKAHLYAAAPARALGIPALWFQHGLPSRSDP